MSTSWVAGTVRAKALARRRLGAAGARELATRPTFVEALEALSRTSYGHDVRTGQSLGEAQHAVGASLLWNMRVLAGWLPRGGADVIRLLAAGFEVANVDEHLARLYGEPADPPYVLGTLDTAWSRVSTQTTFDGVVEALSTSPWRIRGTGTRREVHIGLRLAWADSTIARLPEAAGWARAGAALLLLRELLLEARPLPGPLLQRAAYVLGPAFAAAATDRLPDLALTAATLPPDARWVTDGLDRPQDLWRGEVRWWRRIERDGFALLRVSGFDRRPVVGAVAVLATDAWRVRAALETATRGGAGAALEAFDGVA
ncbi:MAG TPA: hypothetical protein VLA97_14810 [Nocardioidaceae bacterium]|nr:hypothetical protein [Nocardioidaceae bacterium]